MSFSEKKFNQTYEPLDGISPEELISLVEPKTEKAISFEGLKNRLESDEHLSVKFGTDPTGPELHIGHLVSVRILDIFSRAGHNIDLIFGDFTAKVGDPSSRSDARPMLTDEAIASNVSTFRDQIDRYFDTRSENVNVLYNSDWLKDMTLQDVFGYLQLTNLSEAMQRRDFRERMLGGYAISMAEAFYGTMMGIDSEHLDTDVEVGGIDQLLNFHQTRAIQRQMGQEPEEIIMTPILEGTSGGGIKMSKSLGNYIPLTESAKDMFGKVMSIPDELIEKYMCAFAPVTLDEIPGIRQQISDNPLEMKKQLATYMTAISVREYATGAQQRENFERRFAKGIITDEDLRPIIADTGANLIDVLYGSGGYKSRNQLRQLARQGAIKVNGKRIEEAKLLEPNPGDGSVVAVGKKAVFKISTQEDTVE